MALSAIPPDNEPGQGIVAAASTRDGGGIGQQLAAAEDLMQFRRWSIFLPRAYSVESEKNQMYVRSRHTWNPKFFEETRERLTAILRDLQVLQATGFQSTEQEALDAVLQAQWTAVGFLCDRQFHKALTLSEFCREVVDTLATQGTGGSGGLIFWRLLVRVNLGDAYARFRRHKEASEIMKQALELVEQYQGMNESVINNMQAEAKDTQKAIFGSRERVLSGAIYYHLSRIQLETGDHGEALRLSDLMVEVLERFIWDLGDSREDREAEACVLATAYSHRGECEVRRGKYESALAWLQRAQQCVEKHADLCGDSAPILAAVKEHIVHAKHLAASS
jgi:tetratricopeptide (TPR) repeat protein